MVSRAAVVEPPIICTNRTRARMIAAQISRLFIQLLPEGSLSEPPLLEPFWGVRLSSAILDPFVPGGPIRPRATFAYRPPRGGPIGLNLVQRLDRNHGAGCNPKRDG